MVKMEKQPIDWITVNGNHVPIFEGQSKKEAISSFIKDKSPMQKDKSLLSGAGSESDSIDLLDKHNKNDSVELNSNIEVRKWYIEKVSKIVYKIDNNLPMEERARQAFDARNKIRIEARARMADEKTRKLLEEKHPNKTFEEFVQSKMERKGMTREEALLDVSITATKTNAKVNEELSIGGN